MSIDGHRAALWIRVSSADQDVDVQRAQLESWASDRNLDVVKIYEVHASAWRGHHHPDLRRMLADASLGQFDRLMVVATDRLHRSGPAAILSVWKQLLVLDVQLMSRREPFIETSSGAGRAFTELLVMITGWYAQLESDLISERTKAALAKRREAGHTLGRPKGSKDTKKRKRRTARR